MTAPSPDLPMVVWLRALAEHGIHGFDSLIAAGYPPKLVLYKALSASDKGHSDYGTTPRYSWITPKGEAFLAAHRTEGETRVEH
jgi:IMP cyclohydrolase